MPRVKGDPLLAVNSIGPMTHSQEEAVVHTDIS